MSDYGLPIFVLKNTVSNAPKPAIPITPDIMYTYYVWTKNLWNMLNKIVANDISNV